MVAGEDAEAAGVLRQHRGDAELRERSSAIAAGRLRRDRCWYQRGLVQVLVQVVGGLLDAREEARSVASSASRSGPAPEQLHGVAAGSRPSGAGRSTRTGRGSVGARTSAGSSPGRRGPIGSRQDGADGEPSDSSHVPQGTTRPVPTRQSPVVACGRADRKGLLRRPGETRGGPDHGRVSGRVASTAGHVDAVRPPPSVGADRACTGRPSFRGPHATAPWGRREVHDQRCAGCALPRPMVRLIHDDIGDRQGRPAEPGPAGGVTAALVTEPEDAAELPEPATASALSASPLGRAASWYRARRTRASRSSAVGRIPVLAVGPVVDGGRFTAKAVVGEPVPITATVFREGHDAVAATAVLLGPGRPGAHPGPDGAARARHRPLRRHRRPGRRGPVDLPRRRAGATSTAPGSTPP